MNGWMIGTKNVVTGMMNRMLILRVRKLEQWEALLVDRTGNPSVLDCTSKILVLAIGEAMIMNGEGVGCGLNLLYWGNISSDFQVIDRNISEESTVNLLKILLLSSHYFPLSLTQ